jgi:hypothetical protein
MGFDPRQRRVDDLGIGARLNKRDICTIYDVPPWLIAPTEPGERFWWYRTWPQRKWRLVCNGLKRRWRNRGRSG